MASGKALVVVVAGSRALAWSQAAVQAALLQCVAGRPVLQVLHGGARGADALAAAAARRLGWKVVCISADWRRYGRAAGPIRNGVLIQMAIAHAVGESAAAAEVVVIVFPGGAGTASLVKHARRGREWAPVPIGVMEVMGDLSRP